MNVFIVEYDVVLGVSIEGVFLEETKANKLRDKLNDADEAKMREWYKTSDVYASYNTDVCMRKWHRDKYHVSCYSVEDSV